KHKYEIACSENTVMCELEGTLKDHVMRLETHNKLPYELRSVSHGKQNYTYKEQNEIQMEGSTEVQKKYFVLVSDYVTQQLEQQ
ncbi:hypothetical protein L9F63_011955, partial [Diploptera punctata]